MIVCMELLANDRQHALDVLSLSSGELNHCDSAVGAQVFGFDVSPVTERLTSTSLTETTTLTESTSPSNDTGILLSPSAIVGNPSNSASYTRLDFDFTESETFSGAESAGSIGAELSSNQQSNTSADSDSLVAITEASSIEKFDAALDEGFSRLDQSLYGEFRDFTYEIYNDIEDGLKALGSKLGSYADDAGIPIVKPVIDQLYSFDYVDTISSGPSSVTSFARSAVGDINDLRSELLVG